MYNPYFNNPYPFNYSDTNKMDRMNYLQPNNNYQNYVQPTNQFNNMQQVINFECKPVTSIDEAKAASVRLDGNPSYMIDINAKSIYEKRLDMNTGAANFRIYKLLEDADNYSNNNQNYVDYEKIASKEDVLKLNDNFLALSQKQDDILLNLKNLIINGDDVNANESDANTNGSRKPKSNVATNVKK